LSEIANNDLVDWTALLPSFAMHIEQASDRAKALSFDGPKLQISFEPAKLHDAEYREKLIDRARIWRGGSGKSTIYVFNYSDPVPQGLINTLRNSANDSLASVGRARAFPKCNARVKECCLYVGHSYKIESRLRDHLGFGTAGTSSLQLSHWDGHPHNKLNFTAYRLSTPDELLAQLLEEYLWDELRPLLGKRSGK